MESSSSCESADHVNENSTLPLSNGSFMPILGLGGGIFSTDAEDAFVSALELGYRLFDTAPKYGDSEAALGRATKRSSVPRADLFLQTKVGNAGHAATMKSFEASLARLQTSYVDLLLMHSAVNQAAAKEPRSPLHKSSRLQTWRALVELQSAGRVRSIGVCNHSPRQIAQLSPLPSVVQIEHHPLLQRPEALRYCRQHAIAVQVYGSGGGGWQLWRKDAELDVLRTSPLQSAAAAHGRSAHQISLRWALDQGVAVIPKAATREHQAENRKLFDFSLTQEQTASITALDERRSVYRFRDPDEYT
jgi:diketogulonate reductase-like aldo/keto reductase